MTGGSCSARALAMGLALVAARGGEKVPASAELGHDRAQRLDFQGAQLHRLTLDFTRRSRPPRCLAADAIGCVLGARQFHVLDPVLAQEPLHALDGVARVLQQVADALQELDVAWPVET